MDKTLIGRQEERKILEDALASPKPEMLSVIGRRRVGKTYLVKSVYAGQIDFEITGVQHAPRREQLRSFMQQIVKSSQGSFPMTEPRDWQEAFYLLSNFLETRKKQGKLVVFLDELPWLATHNSGFLRGLSWFWNSWAVEQPIVLVVCGSAASWMIKKLVHHKGGLHNRITRRIYLKPFNLHETEEFLRHKHCNFDRYQILLLYMAVGGVPHYLDAVEPGRSAAQNIDRTCYYENGLLRDEFPKLFSSLFEHSDAHERVVRVLADKQMGLTRTEIVRASRMPEGGGASNVIEELLHSGFIAAYQPFGKKKKEALYRLTDEYSLFYLRFIEGHQSLGEPVWQSLSKTQQYVTWTGYAFENTCLKHILQIKKALGISGIHATASSYFKKGTDEEQGVQLDLLIDRSDHTINVCEIKFHAAEYILDRASALDFRNKIAAFKTASKTRKQVFLTLITSFGVKQNQFSLGLVDAEVTIDHLFAS
jgi:hypothetical protein